MNSSTFWKGLALSAVLFLFVGMEAAAQLPVRTQSLQLINATGGATLTQTVNTGAAGSAYGVTWPNEPATDVTTTIGLAGGETAVLLGTYNNGTTAWDLNWIESDGLIDGVGKVNHVTYWNPDDQTLSYSENFEWDGTILGVGMNAQDNSVAAGAGRIQVGPGSAAATTPAATIDLDGATATAVVGVSATTAGTVNVADATTGLGVVLNGNDGSATLGNDNEAGEVVLAVGDGTTNTVTVSAGTQSSGTWTLNMDDTPATGPYYLTPATAPADGATTDFLYTSNGDGTASWAVNPAASLKAGVETPAAGYGPVSITFTTAYAVAPSVTVAPFGPLANGYILQVDNVTTTGFDVYTSAPWAGTAVDGFSWIAVAPYNP